MTNLTKTCEHLRCMSTIRVTTLSAKADSFCDHARGIPPRFGRNAQSERSGKDITGGVDITVNYQSAVRARVNTVSKSFRNIGQAPTPGANLRSVVGVNLDKLPTSVLYFVGELGQKRTPARIVDRTSEHPACPSATANDTCSPEQALDSLVSAPTPAADSAYFNALVSFVNKVDYPDIPNPHTIDVIVQFFASPGPGGMR